MFKIFFALQPDRTFKRLNRFSLFALLLLVCGTLGCRTAPPFPKVDLAEPGWTVHQGQAIWRSKREAPEIVGEILFAADQSGRTFVQFTKTPFPLVIAQTTTNAWQIESPTQDRRYSRQGNPPPWVIWFQLPRAYAGSSLSGKWTWQKSDTDWRLENRSTGEFLEGYFTP
jgi:hypothetical protein